MIKTKTKTVQTMLEEITTTIAEIKAEVNEIIKDQKPIYNRPLSSLHNQILDELSVNPYQSRSDLAMVLSRRMSSICGRVNELKSLNLVRVSGTKRDNATQKTVETLEVV